MTRNIDEISYAKFDIDDRYMLTILFHSWITTQLRIVAPPVGMQNKIWCS